jgi:hypothetical protein
LRYLLATLSKGTFIGPNEMALPHSGDGLLLSNRSRQVPKLQLFDACCDGPGGDNQNLPTGMGKIGQLPDQVVYDLKVQTFPL